MKHILQMLLCYQNNNKHILWPHLQAVYTRDATRELRRTKLTPAHIWLTSYSVMKVSYAVQVRLLRWF